MALAVHEALEALDALQVCRLDKEQTPFFDVPLQSACPMHVQAPSGRSLHGCLVPLLHSNPPQRVCKAGEIWTPHAEHTFGHYVHILP